MFIEFEKKQSFQNALGDVEQLINKALDGEGGLKKVLTGRQLDVLKGVLAGKSNKMISQELELVERTVEYHRNRLMGKLGVHNTSSLVKLVIAVGMIC